MSKSRRRWGDNDKYFGPLTVAFRERWRPWAVVLSSGDEERLQLGPNLWAVYQAATWWASHGEGRSRSSEEISIEREPMVVAMTNHVEWRALRA